MNLDFRWLQWQVKAQAEPSTERWLSSGVQHLVPRIMEDANVSHVVGIWFCPGLRTTRLGPNQPRWSVYSQPASWRGQISLRQHIVDDLEKAGFTDVTVFPASFIAQAQDKQGRAVMMMVGPDETVTVVGWGGMPGDTGTADGITPSKK